MRDGTTQMSFGERAALLGTVRDLWPRVSVEVGSAQGGSLRMVAEHSTITHSFDLAEPEMTPDRVILHTGDSHVLLPSWLEVFNDHIDFAFVDGDHTEEGVRWDVSHLLQSGRCPRCVMLCHDMNNAEVRKGVDRAVADAEAVTYYEPLFLPGYTFAEGDWSGQSWGGFGLIVTGGIDPLSVQGLYGS